VHTIKVPHPRLDLLLLAVVTLDGCRAARSASSLPGQPTKTREELLAIKREDCRVAQIRARDSIPSSGVLAEYRARLSGLLDSISKEKAHVSLSRLAHFLKREVSP